MRITTNMSIRNYQNNLNRTLTGLDNTRTRVMTKRNFNKVSEDPIAASRAYQLRKDYSKTEDYLETLKSIQSELASVEGAQMQIKKACDDAYDLIQQAAGGTLSAEQREIVATSLRELQKSIVLSANTKFGDKFLFGGANTKDVPFILSDDGKTLTYRGLDINDPANEDALKALTGEKIYADLGFGLEEKLSKVPGGVISVKYDGVPLSIKLANSVTDAAGNVIPLKYDTFADTIDSLNAIVTNDTSLGNLQGKIVFSDDNGKLKIDYAAGLTNAQKKDFEIKSLSNAVIQDSLGIFAGDKMSMNTPSITGVYPAVDSANIAGETLTVNYNGNPISFTFPAGDHYVNADAVVTKLNSMMLNDPDIKGNIQFTNNNGKIAFQYKDGLSAANKLPFSITGGSGNLMDSLGLAGGENITSGNGSYQSGTSFKFPSSDIAGKKMTVNFGGQNIDLTFPPAGNWNDISAVAAELNNQLTGTPLDGNITFSAVDGKLSMSHTATGNKGAVSITAGSDLAVINALGLIVGSHIDDTTSLTGGTPTAKVTDERFEIVDSSAYNNATTGLDTLGFGTDNNGISNNLVLLLGQIADRLTDPNFSQASMDAYQDKLGSLRDKVINGTAQLGTKSMFLDDTQKRLEENSFNLNEQITKVENIDMALAITEYMWAQYAYNAALKVGNSLLSSSFIDFMN